MQEILKILKYYVYEIKYVINIERMYVGCYSEFF